jgi:hypothetical protein
MRKRTSGQNNAGLSVDPWGAPQIFSSCVTSLAFGCHNVSWPIIQLSSRELHFEVVFIITAFGINRIYCKCWC